MLPTARARRLEHGQRPSADLLPTTRTSSDVKHLAHAQQESGKKREEMNALAASRASRSVAQYLEFWQVLLPMAVYITSLHQ